MKPLKILGIYRHPLFSNNAIEADRLILQESIRQILNASSQPIDVEMIEESEVPVTFGSYDLILTMAQSEETLKALEINFGDSPIWNSPAAIRNCYRKNMSNVLIGLNVGYVPFHVLSTDQSIKELIQPGTSYWLKRSDFHAITDDDVTLAESIAEAEEKLAKFRSRGVKEVILQQHIHGDIYKFYGVKGQFFKPIRVRSFLESVISPPDFDHLAKVAELSAEALGLQIFGGDCIVDAHGKCHLIDLNDWPSFRICREDASKAIANLSLRHLESIHRLEATRATASVGQA